LKVNGQPAENGCYIAGHHGQYGIDGLADVAAQFGIELLDEDTPAYWRRGAEAEDSDDSIIISNGPGNLGSHIARPDECWDRHVWAGDAIEEKLNYLTEGGCWSWQDGEFFLVQTEVEGLIYVPVAREEGEDYDDAWQKLIDHGPDVGILSFDDLIRGDEYHQFRITIAYEPEE